MLHVAVDHDYCMDLRTLLGVHHRMRPILALISLAAILSLLVPASVSGQGDFTIFVTDYDAIRQLDLKATEGQNGQVNQVSGFAIEANSVVQINQNENLQVFHPLTSLKG